ncbi:hypothetical protein MTO96_045808 [Rhipicephalus appendiculatus]
MSLTRQGDVLRLVSTPSAELAPSQLAEMTRQDLLLSRVKASVGSGELRKLASEEFAAYRKIGAELSIQEDCLLRGCRVVIPEKARKSVLGLDHENHRGIVAMKATLTATLKKWRETV